MRIAIGILLLATASLGHAAELRDVRLVESPDSTRVVFDLDIETTPKVFTLANPDRVIIDFANARRAETLDLAAGQSNSADSRSGLIKAIRSGNRPEGLRVVLDVTAPVTLQSFGLQPSGSYGYRLIVDLATQGVLPAQTNSERSDPQPNQSPGSNGGTEPAGIVAAVSEASALSGVAPATTTTIAIAAAPASTVAGSASAITVPGAADTASVPVLVSAAAPAPGSASISVAPAATRLPAVAPLQLAEKEIVIAVDAGHGGADPGAIGARGLREKDVTLAIAKALARKINAQPGMRAVLTRDSDTYVDLRQRTVKARQVQADLFVSVHANAYKDRSMTGSAVYVLSERGASSEQARWIAKHENEADLVGGVELNDKDDDLAAVLIDISQSATMEASFDLGSRLLSAMGKVNRLQKPQVQQAGFMVLKAPDIPSVLVETAFISNAREEKLLGSAEYQEQMAQSIFEGVRGYFARYRPLQQVVGTRRPDPYVADRARSVPVVLKPPAGAR